MCMHGAAESKLGSSPASEVLQPFPFKAVWMSYSKSSTYITIAFAPALPRVVAIGRATNLFSTWKPINI